MIQRFSTEKQRTVLDIIPFTKEQFFEIMLYEKPTKIFYGQWSTKRPFLEIIEYNESGVKLYCNANSDKTPEQKTLEQVYDFLKYQGLNECYINLTLKTNT